MLRFCVEFQFVLPIEPFFAEAAAEGFLSCVYQHVPAQMVGLFKRPPALPAPVLPLGVGVEVHQGDGPHGDQGGWTRVVQHCLWFLSSGRPEGI